MDSVLELNAEQQPAANFLPMEERPQFIEWLRHVVFVAADGFIVRGPRFKDLDGQIEAEVIVEGLNGKVVQLTALGEIARFMQRIGMAVGEPLVMHIPFGVHGDPSVQCFTTVLVEAPEVPKWKEWVSSARSRFFNR